MSLTFLLFLSITAVLVVFKLAFLVLAATWAIEAAVEQRGLLSGDRRQMLPVHSRATRA